MFCDLSGSGKSTIIRQIEYHSFRVTKPNVNTEISYEIYHDQEVKILDIPGNEEEQWMINRKLANGIVIVFDVRNRKDFNNFVYNVKEVLNSEDTNDKLIIICINFDSAEKTISEEENRLLLKIDTFQNQNLFIQEFNVLTQKIEIE